MTNSKIELVVSARDAASGVFNRLASATRGYQKTLSDLNGTANQVSQTIRNMFLAVGSASLFNKAISSGYKFNSVIEDTRTGIAGLVYSMNEFTDAQGRSVTGAEAFNAALNISSEIQDRLRIQGLKTAATYKQLTDAFNQAYVPAKQAKFDEKQIVDFTVAATQAVGAMRGPEGLHMLGEEVRSILAGTMQPRTTILQPLMEAAGLTNEKIKELAASGQLYTHVMKAFEGATIAADESTKNFSVRLSNLKDAVEQALGEGLKTGFNKTKQLIQDTTDKIVTFDEKIGKITFNEEIISVLKRIDDALFRAIDSVTNLVKSIYDFKNTHPIIFDLIANIGKITLAAIAAGVALRSLGAIIIWVGAQHAANITFITSLFGGWIIALKAITVQTIAASGAMTMLGTAAGAVGAYLSGWQIGAWISQMELGKRTVNEWVQLGMVKFAEFWAYVKHIFENIPIAAKYAFSAIKLVLKSPFISEESYNKQRGEIEKHFASSLAESAKKYKDNLANSAAVRQMLDAEAKARIGLADTTNKVSAETDKLTIKTKAGAAAAYEYNLKYRDINQTLDRLSDIIDKIIEKTKEMNQEAEKIAASPFAGKLIDVEKEYGNNLASAREYIKDAEKIVREAQERVSKAQEDAAKKNAKRDKNDPLYGIEPKVFEALKTAQAKQQEIMSETNQLIEAANKKRLAGIAKINKEIEDAVTDKTQSELEKRIAAEKKWIQETIEGLNVLYKDSKYAGEEYWEKRKRIEEAGAKAIQKINEEINTAILEAESRRRLAMLDMAERQMSMTRAEVASGRLAEYQRIVEYYERMRASAIERNDLMGQLSAEGKIDEARAKIADLTLEVERLTGTFVDGWQRGLREYMYTLQTTFETAQQIAKDTAQAMQQAFSDFFFDAFEGKLKSLADYLNSFLTSVKRAVAAALGQQVTGAITGLFVPQTTGAGSGVAGISGNMFGDWTLGMGFHRGGTADEPTFYRLIPRFHTGVGPDEILSIIRKDEAVFTPGQMKALGNAVSQPDIDVRVTIMNNSQLDAKHKGTDTQWDGRLMIKNVMIELGQKDRAIKNMYGIKDI